MGIAILIVFSIGIYFTGKMLVLWVIRLLRKPAESAQTYIQPKMPESAAPAPATQTRRRDVYIDGNLVDWDILPKYTGRTGWFGLPKYEDVIYGYHRVFESEKYMDTAFKQYVYDVMSAIKQLNNDCHSTNRTTRQEAKMIWFVLVFALPFLGWIVFNGSVIGIILGAMISPIGVFFILNPYGQRAGRNMAYSFRSLTRDDWDRVDINVMESIAREEEMARAFRRSGISGRWYS